ncbi:uncharacterized protein LOC136077728 [Hydra vulgaris]|uniref:Uncharacterized protein LOC136077728 n=1 Tax=Hydra vulgaris TaxID=6087 RepID=A0ABM4BGA6_HYDVU
MTSSGNHLNHAVFKHGKTFEQPVSSKITNWVRTVQKNKPAQSQFEFNRDLCLLICLDLKPFSSVERSGFKNFCSKNTAFQPPSSDCISGSALKNVYTSVKQRVLEVLQSCVSGTLMMDGWTDKRNRLPYFGIRLSVVHDRRFKNFTLAVQPVESHTSEQLYRFVKTVLKEFLPQDKHFLLFNTTDGAANMKKLSKLLGHDSITCTAHGIHLLLTSDSLKKIPELTLLVSKCKEVIKALHFKGYMLSNEIENVKDEELFKRITTHVDQLIADEEDPILDFEIETENVSILPQTQLTKSVSQADESSLEEYSEEYSLLDFDIQAKNDVIKSHEHSSLKNSVPTRWNSTLEMIESILDLKTHVDTVLKKIGKYDLCFLPEDLELLQELRNFLSPFRELTLLVSEGSPNLSCLPLMVTKIKNCCIVQVTDSSAIKQYKKLVRKCIEKRLVVTNLVELACCFDPAIRDVVLTKEKCEILLKNSYDKIKTSLFGSNILPQIGTDKKINFSASYIDNNQNSKTSNAAQDFKKLRLTLLQETAKSSLNSGAILENSNGLQAEINLYLTICDNQSPALLFWKNNAEKFPILASIAKVYLALSIGSVPVECLFSTTGLILNGKRSSLAPFRMNAVCFIHDNYPNAGL